MTIPELLKRLFALAIRIAREEEQSGFARVSEIKGSASWAFIEHLSELPEQGRGQLLHALIKRRFTLEGMRWPEMAVSAPEQREIEHWLKHNNALHGTRKAPFFAFSVREEEFAERKDSITLASRKSIRAFLLEQLKAIPRPITMVHDTREEVRWFADAGNSLRVDGWVDFGRSGEQAASFVSVRSGEQPLLYTATSLLGILGINGTSWAFLETGEERLCSSATVAFFDEVCDSIG